MQSRGEDEKIYQMLSQTLDSLDRRIVEILQQDCSLTMSELAERTGSTPATCHRRMRNLLAAGVIEQRIAIADRSLSLEPVTAVIGLAIREQARERQHLVRQFIREQPSIRMAWVTTGEFDYIAVGAFSSIDDLRKFVDQVVSGNELFRSYRTYLALDEIKMSHSRRFI